MAWQACCGYHALLKPVRSKEIVDAAFKGHQGSA
jgi:hypothetical protein